jgi:competence protein ComGF
MSSHSREGQKSLLNLILEVVLISIGVFLALWANNWHEEREHRALAHSTLLNFADELRANQQAIRSERQYHETLARQLHEFLISNEPPTDERLQKSVQFKGVRPIIFEHTAWDLALATQALSYLKPELAFNISKVYTAQSAFQTLENSFLASAFTPATFSSDNVKGLVAAMEYYLRDINQKEPAILQLYDKVIPEVDQALSTFNTR